jgi:hypothetical protein
MRWGFNSDQASANSLPADPSRFTSVIQITARDRRLPIEFSLYARRSHLLRRQFSGAKSATRIIARPLQIAPGIRALQLQPITRYNFFYGSL